MTLQRNLDSLSEARRALDQARKLPRISQLGCFWAGRLGPTRSARPPARPARRAGGAGAGRSRAAAALCSFHLFSKSLFYLTPRAARAVRCACPSVQWQSALGRPPPPPPRGAHTATCACSQSAAAPALGPRTPPAGPQAPQRCTPPSPAGPGAARAAGAGGGDGGDPWSEPLELERSSRTAASGWAPAPRLLPRRETAAPRPPRQLLARDVMPRRGDRADVALRRRGGLRTRGGGEREGRGGGGRGRERGRKREREEEDREGEKEREAEAEAEREGGGREGERERGGKDREGERERGGKRERGKDREGGRQRGRKTEREKDREGERQRRRGRERAAEKQLSPRSAAAPTRSREGLGARGPRKPRGCGRPWRGENGARRRGR